MAQDQCDRVDVTSDDKAKALTGDKSSAERRSARRAARAAAPRLERNDNFATLSLSDLRTAEGILRDEKTRIEYWRRVLQSRLVRTQGDVSVSENGRLASVLVDAVRSPAAIACVPGMSAAATVSLQDLAEIWSRRVDLSDPMEIARHEADLEHADRVLDGYLKCVTQGIRSLTDEVIVRYREEPRLALLLLPGGRSPSSNTTRVTQVGNR